MSVLRKMQIGPYLPPCTKLKSNGSKTSTQPRYCKPDRRGSGQYAQTHWHRRQLSEWKTQRTGTDINNYYTRPYAAENLGKTKETVTWTKQWPTKWEKSFDN